MELRNLDLTGELADALFTDFNEYLEGTRLLLPDYGTNVGTGIEGLLTRIRTGEIPMYVVHGPGGPACLVGYDLTTRKHPCLGFLHVLKEVRQAPTRDAAITYAIEHMPFCFPFTKVGIDLHRFCRFSGDRMLLERLGFEVQEWFWAGVDLYAFDQSPRVLEGYSVCAWHDQYVEQICSLDWEGRLVVERGGYDVSHSKICLLEEGVCGFILAHLASLQTLEIDYLYVSEPHRRKDIARTLEITVLREARARGVKYAITSINSTNKAALHLIEDIGYKVVMQDGLYGERSVSVKDTNCA